MLPDKHIILVLKGVSLMGDKNMKPKSGCKSDKSPKAASPSKEKDQAKSKPKKK